MTRFGESVVEGARRARRAQAAWKRGDAGYYVCNIETEIIVRGPFASLNVAELRAAEHEPPSMGVVER